MANIHSESKTPFYKMQYDALNEMPNGQFRVISTNRDAQEFFVKSMDNNYPLIVKLNPKFPLIDGDIFDLLIPGEQFVMTYRHLYFDCPSDDEAIEVVLPIVVELAYGDIRPDPEIPSSYPSLPSP